MIADGEYEKSGYTFYMNVIKVRGESGKESLTINGGTFTSTKGDAVEVDSGKVVFNGGTYQGCRHTVHGHQFGSMEILFNGGTFLKQTGSGEDFSTVWIFPPYDFTGNCGTYYGDILIAYNAEYPDRLYLKAYLGDGVKAYINGVLASDEALRSGKVSGAPIEFKK